MAEHDGEVRLPREWPDAHPYLERYLESRRGHIESRLDALERTDQAILAELGKVHESVSKLHAIHIDTNERYAALVNFQGAQIQEQHERWKMYDAEQQEILRLTRAVDKRTLAEDLGRKAWRITYLVGLFVILFAVLIHKAG